jgi:prepilin-type N-terminal cleavage/methylation domain-containing protein
MIQTKKHSGQGFTLIDCHAAKRGFTLIELSIVLVIIGLIAGGVLVGQDLINAAAIRAQISQIEKYNTAVNTFRGKYGYLPGDIPDPYASQYGFYGRGQYPGEGDGDGLIEGVFADGPGNGTYNDGSYQGIGETPMFWVDLTKASLIDGGFSLASSTQPPSIDPVTLSSSPNLNAYFPQAKLGAGNYIYVWGDTTRIDEMNGFNNFNFFGISAISVLGGAGYPIFTSPGLSVQQAYAIDQKMDDGLPQSGKVIAMYLGGFARWAGDAYIPGGPAGSSAYPVTSGTGIKTVGAPTTCYDNGNVAGAMEQYSMSQNGGAGINCALSFQFQ